MNVSPWEDGRLPQPALPLAATFEGFLDLKWEELSPDFAAVTFRVRDDLKQPLGLLHGGIYAAVAETVASVATGVEVWRDGMSVSGMSNSAHFLRPVRHGSVRVAARRRHHDESEWLWSHEFFDEDDRLCALVEVRIAVRLAQ